MSGPITSQSQIITMLERPGCMGNQATEFGALVQPTAVVGAAAYAPTHLQKRPKKRTAGDIAFRLTVTLLLGMIGILTGAIAAEVIGRIS